MASCVVTCAFGFFRNKKFSRATHASNNQGSSIHFSSEDANNGCAICLEEFAEGEDVCTSQNDECPHLFHCTCAFEWLLKSQECPCCRRDYLTIEDGDSDQQQYATLNDTSSNPQRVDDSIQTNNTEEPFGRCSV